MSRLFYLALLFPLLGLGGCVREGELVPIEVSPRLAARMGYVGALPSRMHAASKSEAMPEAGEQSEEPEPEEPATITPETRQNHAPNTPPPHATPVKTLAADGGAD